MATPSEKSPAMASALERLFGRTTAIENDTCVVCQGEAKEFEDALSKKEFTISGMCQKCQNKTF